MRFDRTGHFKAKGESGTIYTVIEWQTMIQTRMMDGMHETPGTTFLSLSDGRDVNVIDDTTFQIVSTGEVIRKIA